VKAECNITAGEGAKRGNGEIISGSGDTPVDTITTDSRELGPNSLFVPLKGEKFDGHDFIDSMCEKKIIDSFLTMDGGHETAAAANNITAIRCKDTLNALGCIASAHRENVNPRVVGITGTNGKTTTKEIIYTILNHKYRTLRNEKNYNNEIGVPFTLLNLREDHDVAVVEMGMNHPGEIERLSNIVQPDLAVITNIGEGHLEFLGSVENVGHAKSEIMSGMKEGSRILLNRDTNCFDMVESKALDKGIEIKTFGLEGNADVFPQSYRLFEDGLEIDYNGESLSVPLYGIHNVYNMICAIAVAEDFSLGIDDIKKSMAEFNNVDGRSQIIDMGYILINDTYNSNPLSSKYALRSVSEIYTDRRKVAVLSDMKELGETSEYYHIEIGKTAAEYGFDRLCVWGEMSDAYLKGALDSGFDKNSAVKFNTKEDLIAYLKQNIFENDVVLVKGSRSMKMEDVVKAMQERG